MTIRDMITHLHTKVRMEVRDERGYELFTCSTDSAVLLDYWDKEITEWSPHPAWHGRNCDFTVMIKDEE